MNTLNKNLELRKALAEVDRLTSENIELKDNLYHLIKKKNQLLQQIDDINTIVKYEGGYQIDSDEFIKAFDRLQEKGGFPYDAASRQAELDKENEQAVRNAEDPNYPTRDELDEYKYRLQVALFQIGIQSPYERERIIKEILK